jgi:hypothetical protein
MTYRVAKMKREGHKMSDAEFVEASCPSKAAETYIRERGIAAKLRQLRHSTVPGFLFWAEDKMTEYVAVFKEG